MPDLNLKFETALEDLIQYLTPQYFCFGNIMCKYVKWHFSVNTNILDFFKFASFFMGFTALFCFLIPYSRDCKIRLEANNEH